MTATDSRFPGFHAPSGEPLPMIVWLDRGPPGVAAELVQLGAFVVTASERHAASADAALERRMTGADPAVAWPDALAAPAGECLARFGRVYVLRVVAGTGPALLAAGVPGTPASDADPWTVALLAGAIRDCGLEARIDVPRSGGGTSDALQGVELALRAGTAFDGALRAAVTALADGLRIAQLKC